MSLLRKTTVVRMHCLVPSCIVLILSVLISRNYCTLHLDCECTSPRAILLTLVLDHPSENFDVLSFGINQIWHAAEPTC